MKYKLPKGFLASAVHCGIKRFKKDLVLIYSRTGCKAAGVFTKNKVKAAPVIVSREILKKGKPIKAIIINSGNANCCTGWYGTRDAKRTIEAVCKNADLKFNNVLVSSTGIIGKRLPITEMEAAVPKLVKFLSEKGLRAAAQGIVTTDKNLKISCESVKIGGKEVTISAIAKGAGMIHPNMATMLCFIMTDVNIDKDALKAVLKDATDGSFNTITIDGDMSTNDSVMMLANGLAGNRAIKKRTKEYRVFLAALKKSSMKLAKDIILDGEGATKLLRSTSRTRPGEAKPKKWPALSLIHVLSKQAYSARTLTGEE